MVHGRLKEDYMNSKKQSLLEWFLEDMDSIKIKPVCGIKFKKQFPFIHFVTDPLEGLEPQFAPMDYSYLMDKLLKVQYESHFQESVFMDYTRTLK
jgi:hypothetical protein